MIWQMVLHSNRQLRTEKDGDCRGQGVERLDAEVGYTGFDVLVVDSD